MRQRSVIIKSFLIALSLVVGINTSAHARYYEPTMGRFISPDTIVPNANDPQSLNRYSYVRNNPVVLTDPDGHFFVVPILIAAAVSAAVNATMAATNGANSSGIWTATWQGAVQGAVFAGTIALGGGPFLGGALSGGLGGALNGGGTEGAFQGAAFGAFTASVSSQVPVPKNAWAAAATRIGVGAGAGGAVAGAMGGSVREGATQGALYAAVSMAYSGAASQAQRNHYSKQINRVMDNSNLTGQEKIEKLQGIYTKAGQSGVRGLPNVTIQETTRFPVNASRTWGRSSNNMGSNMKGPWLTTEKYDFRIEAGQMNALPDWNTAEFSTNVIIPPGANVQWGISSPQFNSSGGGIEIFSNDFMNFQYGETRHLK